MHAKNNDRSSDVATIGNLAKRLLLLPVIWRKCGSGIRTRQEEKFGECLLSLRQTGRLRGKRVHFCLTEAFEYYLAARKPIARFADAGEARRSVLRHIPYSPSQFYCSESSFGRLLPRLLFAP